MVVVWLVFGIIAGVIGSSRKIGFFASFLLSIFLSPVVGVIIALCSTTLMEESYKEKLLKAQEEQNKLLEKISKGI